MAAGEPGHRGVRVLIRVRMDQGQIRASMGSVPSIRTGVEAPKTGGSSDTLPPPPAIKCRAFAAGTPNGDRESAQHGRPNLGCAVHPMRPCMLSPALFRPPPTRKGAGEQQPCRQPAAHVLTMAAATKRTREGAALLFRCAKRLSPASIASIGLRLGLGRRLLN